MSRSITKRIKDIATREANSADSERRQCQLFYGSRILLDFLKAHEPKTGLTSDFAEDYHFTHDVMSGSFGYRREIVDRHAGGKHTYTVELLATPGFSMIPEDGKKLDYVPVVSIVTYTAPDGSSKELLNGFGSFRWVPEYYLSDDADSYLYGLRKFAERAEDRVARHAVEVVDAWIAKHPAMRSKPSRSGSRRGGRRRAVR
jgi:hypothetical protein